MIVERHSHGHDLCLDEPRRITGEALCFERRRVPSQGSGKGVSELVRPDIGQFGQVARREADDHRPPIGGSGRALNRYGCFRFCPGRWRNRPRPGAEQDGSKLPAQSGSKRPHSKGAGGCGGEWPNFWTPAAPSLSAGYTGSRTPKGLALAIDAGGGTHASKKKGSRTRAVSSCPSGVAFCRSPSPLVGHLSRTLPLDTPVAPAFQPATPTRRSALPRAMIMTTDPLDEQ
jgi:hypothetical protein